MQAITIFWKDGNIIGACQAGHESEFGGFPDKQQRKYDYTTSSTEERWQAYAKHRVGFYPQTHSKREMEENERQARALL
jgi:hypothetical protein